MYVSKYRSSSLIYTGYISIQVRKRKVRFHIELQIYLPNIILRSEVRFDVQGIRINILDHIDNFRERHTTRRKISGATVEYRGVGCVPVHSQTITISNKSTNNPSMVGPKGTDVGIVSV